MGPYLSELPFENLELDVRITHMYTYREKCLLGKLS